MNKTHYEEIPFKFYCFWTLFILFHLWLINHFYSLGYNEYLNQILLSIYNVLSGIILISIMIIQISYHVYWIKEDMNRLMVLLLLLALMPVLIQHMGRISWKIALILILSNLKDVVKKYYQSMVIEIKSKKK